MKKSISIVGGGASALMLGCELDSEKYSVSIFEKNTALGRKFLIAGDGGLNLTHSEKADKFISRYTPREFLIPAFRFFSNEDLIAWFNDLGIDTFIGSSGRVFPIKGIKPIDVLTAIEQKIIKNKVAINFKHELIGFSDDNDVIFKTPSGNKNVVSDIVIFCLGGASWPVSGSKGDWLNFFTNKNISTKPFQASNCSFKVDWPKDIIKAIEGKPLKNVSISCGKKIYFGEIVITSFGLEGSGIYSLSPEIRNEIENFGSAKIVIDLKPKVSVDELVKRISNISKKISYTENIAKQLNLNKTQIILLKAKMSKNEFLDPIKFVNNLKNFEISISELGPIADAISTVGGIPLTEITEAFELKKLKNKFVVGEMLDYDAPTGGYLLQSCFTMGKFLANYLNKLD
ncbi:MAG: NAD(P)-dependent oxidoreductase [Bacteroidota bacterium]|nr:NAD(P)-dependent oxidoreductase [Bacteroidota bacterium]MDP3146330.1 NAD(P)-dependent oxidoreductase [Bacteroidota bacterium]